MKLEHYTFQGSIGAFDTATGKQRWNYVTTPNDSTSGAGQAVWSTPSVDRDLGLLYIGTGQNLSPPAGPLGDSFLALDYLTGKVRWTMQATKDDVFSAGYPEGFDFDFGASPNLFTVKGRKLVGNGDKEGSYWVLDARTGRVVWKRKLTPAGHFGGVIGSAGFHDGRLLVSSNVGDPKVIAPAETSKVFALSPADGKVLWTVELKGSVFGAPLRPRSGHRADAVDPRGSRPGRRRPVRRGPAGVLGVRLHPLRRTGQGRRPGVLPFLNRGAPLLERWAT